MKRSPLYPTSLGITSAVGISVDWEPSLMRRGQPCNLPRAQSGEVHFRAYVPGSVGGTRLEHSLVLLYARPEHEHIILFLSLTNVNQSIKHIFIPINNRVVQFYATLI